MTLANKAGESAFFLKRNICLFQASVQRWGYKPSVECPFKLFTAQSGVFFSSDLKMGIGGHPFFPEGSPSPLFLLASSSSSCLCLLLKCRSAQTLGNKERRKVQTRTPLDLYATCAGRQDMPFPEFPGAWKPPECRDFCVFGTSSRIGWGDEKPTCCPSGLRLQWNEIYSK